MEVFVFHFHKIRCNKVFCKGEIFHKTILPYSEVNPQESIYNMYMGYHGFMFKGGQSRIWRGLHNQKLLFANYKEQYFVIMHNCWEFYLLTLQFSTEHSLLQCWPNSPSVFAKICTTWNKKFRKQFVIFRWLS